MMSLREFLEMTSRAAESTFNAHGALAPLYHLVLSDDTHGLIEPPPVEDKDLGVDVVKALMRQLGCVRYAFIDEAWMATCKEVPKNIRDHPDREEIVVIVAEDKSGEELVATRKIIRVEGSPPRLGPLEYMDGGPQFGRMTRLLADETVH